MLYARTFQKTRPEIGAAEEEICGGHMIFAGLGSPIGRATGVGLDRPFTAEDLDRVEAVLPRAQGSVAGGFVSHARCPPCSSCSKSAGMRSLS